MCDCAEEIQDGGGLGVSMWSPTGGLVLISQHLCALDYSQYALSMWVAVKDALWFKDTVCFSKVTFLISNFEQKKKQRDKETNERCTRRWTRSVKPDPKLPNRLDWCHLQTGSFDDAHLGKRVIRVV